MQRELRTRIYIDAYCQKTVRMHLSSKKRAGKADKPKLRVNSYTTTLPKKEHTCIYYSITYKIISSLLSLQRKIKNDFLAGSSILLYGYVEINPRLFHCYR